MDELLSSEQIQNTFKAMLQDECDEFMNDKTSEENKTKTNASNKSLIKSNMDAKLQINTCNKRRQMNNVTKNYTNIKDQRKKHAESVKAQHLNIAEKVKSQNNNNSYISSSEEEIFQTRFSLNDENTYFEKTQHSNNTSSISSVELPNIKNIEGNDSNSYRSPIIIQAKAVPSSANNKYPLQSTHTEKHEIDLSNRNFLDDQANISIAHLFENDSNFKDNKKRENKPKNSGKCKQSIKNMIGINENNSTGLEPKDSKIQESDDDSIIKDFFNGTLDLSICRSDKQNIKNNEKVSSSTSIAPERKVMNNFYKNRLQEILSPETSYPSLKRKQANKKLEKNAKKPCIAATQNKKSKKLATSTSAYNLKQNIQYSIKQNTDSNSEFSNEDVLHKFKKQNRTANHSHNIMKSATKNVSKVKLQKTFLNKNDSSFSRNYEDNTFHKLNEKNKTANNNHERNNAAKNMSKIKTLTHVKKNTSASHSGRQKRNSSLVASRKIKEIGKIENSKKFEEINLSSSDESILEKNDQNSTADECELETKSAKSLKFNTESFLCSTPLFNKNNLNYKDSYQLYPAEELRNENNIIGRNNVKSKNIFTSTLNGSSLKNVNKKKIASKGSHSRDFGLFKNKFMEENELHKNFKRQKKNKRDPSVSSENVFPTIKNETARGTPKSKLSSVINDIPLTRYRKKSWEMLEKELLGELDNEIALTNNNKNIIKVKQKDTARESIKGKSNTQQEINEKGKNLKPQPNRGQILNVLNNMQPNSSKSLSKVEGAIAAMNKSTEKFITPQVNHKSTPNVEVQRSVNYIGTITRHRQKSWEMLEEELLGESHNEIPPESNKEIILVKKKQTARKSICGKEYNMQYEINTEDMYLQPKISANKISNLTYKTQSKEIVPSSSKALSIIEKTIAAMNKSTAKFLKPQISSDENVQTRSDPQMGETSNYSKNANMKSFLDSNITYMSNEYYYKNEKNEIYMKKSIAKDSSSASNENECRDSDSSEYLEEDSFQPTNSYLKKNTAKIKSNEIDKTVVPIKEDKNDYSWKRLLRRMSLDEDYKSQKDRGGEEKAVQLKRKPMIPKHELNKKFINNKRKMITSDYKVQELDKKGKTEKEQVILEPTENAEGIFINQTFQYSNSKVSEHFPSIVNARSKSNSTHKKVAEMGDNSSEKITRDLKRNTLRVSKQSIIIKSPMFKLQPTNSGAVKLKIPSSGSSSVSSEEFQTPKQNNKKYNESADFKNNKAKEKYKTYLKDLCDNQHLFLKAKAEDNHNSMMQDEDERENSENDGKNDRFKSIKLIAEREEDLFSLTSSDSGTDNERSGSGVLCDLFEEWKK